MMAEEEVSPQESAIAVALTGAFLGIYVFDNIITAGVLAALASYLTTTDSQAGDIATSTGARHVRARPDATRGGDARS